jgi:hypothetical protein
LNPGIYFTGNSFRNQTFAPGIGLFKKHKMQKSWKYKTGIFLIVLSTLLFASLLVFPFLEIAGKTKITLSTIAVILGEIAFWTGGILLGKELFGKYKAYLNPANWFKKKTDQAETDDSLTNAGQ